MRLITVTTLVLLLSGALNAQTYVGLRGQGASTWMFNKNLSDNGDIVDYKGTFTAGGGVSIIHYLGETVGVEVGLGTNTIAQRTQGEFGDSKYVFESSVNYLEITTLFKTLSEGGSYFEVGPIFMLNNSESEQVIENPDDIPFPLQADLDRAVEGDFSSLLIFGVIGFGVNFDVAENLKAGVGLRLGYSIMDSVERVTEEEFVAPEPELGWYSSIAHTDASADLSGEFSPETTNAAYAALNVGLYYVFD